MVNKLSVSVQIYEIIFKHITFYRTYFVFLDKIAFPVSQHHTWQSLNIHEYAIEYT